MLRISTASLYPNLLKHSQTSHSPRKTIPAALHITERPETFIRNF